MLKLKRLKETHDVYSMLMQTMKAEEVKVIAFKCIKTTFHSILKYIKQP